jgi:hypothetical protein
LFVVLALCFGRAADDRGQICPSLKALLELQSEIGGASGFIAPAATMDQRPKMARNHR